MTKRCMAILATFVSLAVGASPATAHEPPRLVEYLSSDEWSVDSLSADQAATLESIRSDPAAIDVRIGQAYPGAVRIAGALSLVVPPASGANAAVTVSFHDLDIELRSEHDYSLHARDEASGSEVSLVVMEPDVLGTIRRGADEYRVHPLGGGLTAVYRYDSSRLELQSEDDVAAGEAKDQYFASAGNTVRPPGPPAASEDGAPVIDVLFAYTWQARIESGNVGALILHAIDQINRIFANSRIRARVRLVYSYQTGYAQNENLYTDLSHLLSPDDGQLDETHAMRDRYGADFIVLMRGRHRYSCESSYSYSSYFSGQVRVRCRDAELHRKLQPCASTRPQSRRRQRLRAADSEPQFFVWTRILRRPRQLENADVLGLASPLPGPLSLLLQSRRFDHGYSNR